MGLCGGGAEKTTAETSATSPVDSPVGQNTRSSLDSSVAKPRSGAIDFVRVLGIVAVVAGHTIPSPIVRQLLYSWHVPLFFVLAGYLWSADRTLRGELVTRTRTLLRPLLTWLLLIGTVFVLVDGQIENNVWQRLVGPLTDGKNSAMPFTTFWFVTALFFSALLFRLLWHLPRPVTWAAAAIGLILSFTIGPQLASTPLSIGSAIPCVAFLALGLAARSARPFITRPGLLGCVLLAASFALVVSGLALPLDIKQGVYGTPVVSDLVAVAISFGLVLVAERLSERLPASFGRVATVLAYGGFMVVLTHPLVIWAMERFEPSVPSWLLFTLCLLIPWAFALGALRTRASTWFTGATRQGPSDSGRPRPVPRRTAPSPTSRSSP